MQQVKVVVACPPVAAAAQRVGAHGARLDAAQALVHVLDAHEQVLFVVGVDAQAHLALADQRAQDHEVAVLERGCGAAERLAVAAGEELFEHAEHLFDHCCDCGSAYVEDDFCRPAPPLLG